MAQACISSGRNEKDVSLMMVTKTVHPDLIRLAASSREVLVGENKVQEALSKQEALKDLALEWHLIGHLQSNKIKDALKFAHCIQSIDSLALAQKLNTQIEKNELPRFPILVQINTSYEDSKSGITPEAAKETILQIAEMPFLKINGLMTIGPLSDDMKLTQQAFANLKRIFEDLKSFKNPNLDLNILSMGMSADMELAIKEGSTMVRVGSAIFGMRG